MAFGTGQTVGDYEFIDVLESSKNGVTYKVRNVLAQRFEALKVLPKNLQADRERVDRFLREMKVHARLAHPNIVTFYNAAQIEGQLVMTTELVEGMTLAQHLESGPLPFDAAIHCLCQVLEALSYAHQQGVVHREITPANILVTPEGTVKLTGFGLAKAMTDPQLTRVGDMLGSLHYMAPEQVKGAPTLDARTDIYALGAVLYEAVTGKPPFHAESQFDIMVAHVNKAPAPPSHINPDAPAELDEIILRALAKEPAQRFQNAREFREVLDRLQPASEPAEPAQAEAADSAGAAPALPPMTSSPAASPPAAQRPRASMELIAAGAALFVILAVAFFIFLSFLRL